jgi:catechol 2,3-dioxygenase-like lactoylglutathione lyase family enzyme
MRIGLTEIFVDDQDRAERFSSEVLGFQVKTSAAYGPGEHWLSVVSPRGAGRGGTRAAPDRRPGAGVP